MPSAKPEASSAIVINDSDDDDEILLREVEKVEADKNKSSAKAEASSSIVISDSDDEDDEVFLREVEKVEADKNKSSPEVGTTVKAFKSESPSAAQPKQTLVMKIQACYRSLFEKGQPNPTLKQVRDEMELLYKTLLDDTQHASIRKTICNKEKDYRKTLKALPEGTPHQSKTFSEWFRNGVELRSAEPTSEYATYLRQYRQDKVDRNRCITFYCKRIPKLGGQQCEQHAIEHAQQSHIETRNWSPECEEKIKQHLYDRIESPKFSFNGMKATGKSRVDDLIAKLDVGAIKWYGGISSEKCFAARMAKHTKTFTMGAGHTYVRVYVSSMHLARIAEVELAYRLREQHGMNCLNEASALGALGPLTEARKNKGGYVYILQVVPS